MAKYILVNNFRCRTCGAILLSLHRHDFRQCVCGNSIDGGFDYSRRGGNPENFEILPIYWKKGAKDE